MQYITAIALLTFMVRLIFVKISESSATGINDSASASLCPTCAYAHIARGACDRRELIAATCAGSVRALKFAVFDCTMYCDRRASAELVGIVGFAESRAETSFVPSAAAKEEE